MKNMQHPNGYILVFDHGTTSVRACLTDHTGRITARSGQAIPQIYPQPGWVEQDAMALWHVTLEVAHKVLQGIGWERIVVAGIANQRETVILWDRETGEPVHPAIVWQCRRTAEFCEQLKQSGHAETIAQKTGLVIDAYFSASKIHWLLNRIPEAATLRDQNRLLFGTVDTWILWKLSGGSLHITDLTNASRTMLFNIHEKRWDADLLTLFGVPECMLPTVKASNEIYGCIDLALTGGVVIPLAGNVGDQQAALYGQKCWTAGSAKITYGTGAFLLMNTGTEAVRSRKGLLTTLATDAMGESVFALEGAVFFAGATLEWLQNKLNAFSDFSEVDLLANSLPNNGGVYLVPAFAGLGAPHWNANARTLLTGVTQESGRTHLVRAALEAMAYQTREVLDVMQAEAGLTLDVLRVDGGVTRSGFLMQFLADILNRPVLRTDDPELTAKGAGYLAGLAVGYWRDPEAIRRLPETLECFKPTMDAARREALFAGWKQAVRRAIYPNTY